jgi:4-amino-4-deoxy-L-arabinose transferase-like glycosyltransferase
MSTLPGEIASIRIKVTVAVVLFVLGLAAILLHILVPAWKSEIEFAAVIVGGAATVYAAYYAAISLRIAIDQNKDRNSFELLKELNHIDSSRIRLQIKNKLPSKSLSAQQIHQKILEDSELLAAVNTMLGFFEDTSIAIVHDHVNERILYDSLLFLVPWTFNTLWPYIEEERKQDLALYVEIERLSVAWEAKKSLKTNQLFKP